LGGTFGGLVTLMVVVGEGDVLIWSMRGWLVRHLLVPEEQEDGRYRPKHVVFLLLIYTIV